MIVASGGMSTTWRTPLDRHKWFAWHELQGVLVRLTEDCGGPSRCRSKTLRQVLENRIVTRQAHSVAEERRPH